MRARAPRRGSALVALFAAALLALAYAALRWAPTEGIAPEIPLGATTLVAFEPSGEPSTVRAIGPAGLHLFGSTLALTPHRLYDVQLEVAGPPALRVLLHVDFSAGAYDVEEAKDRVLVAGDSPRRTIRMRLASGDAPPRALLRVFYDGPPGLEISDVRVRLLPAWFRPATSASGWAAAIAVVALLVLLPGPESARWGSLVLSPISERTGWACVLAFYAGGVLFRFLVYEQTPYWSGDEYWYKSLALGIWAYGSNGILSAQQVGDPLDYPNALYPHVIAPAFALGERFYSGIRLINAILMNAAIFPAYGLARCCFDVRTALVFAVFALCVPAMGLGAFAVTEVLFYPAYLFAAWAAVRALLHGDRWVPSVMVGVCAAVATNVRANGAVLLPVFLVAFFGFSWLRGDGRRLLRAPTWLGSLAGFALVHSLFQASLRGAGAQGLGRYGVDAETEQITSLLDAITQAPTAPFRLVAGHLLTLAMPHAFALGALAFAPPMLSRAFRDRPRELAVVLVAGLAFGSAVAVCLGYTSIVSTRDLGGLDRWHSRYYFVAYPLLLLGGMVVARRLDDLREPLPALRWAVALTGCAIVAGGAFVLFATSVPQAEWFGAIADNMDVQWLRYWPRVYLLLAALMTAGSLAWALRRPRGVRLFVGGMVAWCIVATLGVARHSGVGQPEPPEACGRAMAGLVASSENAFGVFGSSRPEMVGIAFWMPRPPAVARQLSPGSRIDEALAGVEPVRLVLLNGDLVPPTGAALLRRSGGCRAYLRGEADSMERPDRARRSPVA